MSDGSISFSEVWRWQGWTNIDEVCEDGTIDGDDHLIIVGTSDGATTDRSDDTFVDTPSGDFSAVKLDGSTGSLLWTWTGTSLGDESDWMFAADTDSSNDVVLGGFTTCSWVSSFSNPENVRHLAAVKLDGATGEEIWRYQEVAPHSTATEEDYIYYGSGTVAGVAVNGEDDVFLAGQIYGSLEVGEGDPGDSDYFLIKLDGATGDEIWTVQGGSNLSFDAITCLEIDSAGDLVSAGLSGDEGEWDIKVLKFSGDDGSTIWEYTSPTFTRDYPNGIAFDDEGHVYVGGVEDLASGYTPIALKLNEATGALMWTHRGNSTSSGLFSSVAVDPTTGWVVAVGYSVVTWSADGDPGDQDFVAVVLDGDTGAELSRYEDGTTGTDGLCFAGFDSNRGLLFGGYSDGDWGGDASGSDFTAIKFDPLQNVGVATVTASGDESLSTGIIAAIAGGAVLLALLVLCILCRICKTPGKKTPATAEVVAEVTTASKTSKESFVNNPPPSYSSRVLEAKESEPSSRPLPMPPVPATPPPMYVSPTQTAQPKQHHPPANDGDQGCKAPPPAYDEAVEEVIPEVFHAVEDKDKPWQKLAKRKGPAPSNEGRTQAYPDIPTRLYAPYAPAANPR